MELEGAVIEAAGAVDFRVAARLALAGLASPLLVLPAEGVPLLGVTVAGSGTLVAAAIASAARADAAAGRGSACGQAEGEESNRGACGEALPDRSGIAHVFSCLILKFSHKSLRRLRG